MENLINGLNYIKIHINNDPIMEADCGCLIIDTGEKAIVWADKFYMESIGWICFDDGFKYYI